MTQRNVKVSERAYQRLVKMRDDHNETGLRLRATQGYWDKWSMADAVDSLIQNRDYLALELNRKSTELRQERGQSLD